MIKMSFSRIDPKELQGNVFRMLDDQWTLITAGDKNGFNTMTASWGGLGVIWGRNAAYVFVRDSRYTKEFMDASDTFSLTFFDREKYAEMLAYMGKVSGRDEDKIARWNLSVEHTDGTPYFGEAKIAITCRKMCRQPIAPENFIDPTVDEKFYPTKDYHDMYIGEITHILVK